MLSASQQKYLTSLHIKKYRQKYQKFLIEGTKIVAELLQQDRIKVDAIFGTNAWATENATLLAPFNDLFTEITAAELKKVSTLTTPNQVLAVGTPPEAVHPGLTPNGKGVVLFLDAIQDPGNMGTILRIADWFGIEMVYCGQGCVDAYSPKVVQAGMGACFRVPIAEDIDLNDLRTFFPDLALVGAVMNGADAFKTTIPRPALLVIGNEGRGISAAVEALLTHRITIPHGDNGRAESLNAGVATGILLTKMLYFNP
jgi:RNA methyltransferase, TrmH family